MPESGTAFSTDDRGGLIAAAAPPTPVSYDAIAIAAGGGRPPREHERVAFDRAPGAKVATSVRVASSVDADLTMALRGAFERHVDSDSIGEDARAEVVRMAADRAARARRPATSAGEVAEEVVQARIALATAAMSLLAVEAREMAPEELTALHLREILRRQRPRLPR